MARLRGHFCQGRATGVYQEFHSVGALACARVAFEVPSPLGHALGGVFVGVLARRWSPRFTAPPRWALLACVAMAPDLDLLVGRHSGETHSLGAVCLVWLAAFGIRRWGPARAPLSSALGWALACGAAYTSHLLLDALGTDNARPIGIMAFWPLSANYVKFPLQLFPPVPRNPLSARFWSGMPMALFIECLTLCPMVWLASRAGRQRHRRRPRTPVSAGEQV